MKTCYSCCSCFLVIVLSGENMVYSYIIPFILAGTVASLIYDIGDILLNFFFCGHILVPSAPLTLLSLLSLSLDH